MRRYLYNIITGREQWSLSFIIRPILILFSFLYYLVVKLRLTLYKTGIFRSCRLKHPVISVGNITWGGTGKTPLVETICSHFASSGKKVTLLIRGYGMDEDRLLAEKLSGVTVLTGKDRARNARRAEAKRPTELFVMDDGFQHLRIRRDIDIVTVNATDAFGNGHLIPAGILREPVTHISRAGIAVITKSDLVPKEKLDLLKEVLLKHNPQIGIYESIHQLVSFYTGLGHEKPLGYINGKRICALSALGDNSSFKDSLKNIGSDIGLCFSHMDHHRYTREDVGEVLKGCAKAHVYTVVTTQKDWVKLKTLFDVAEERIEFLILNIRLKVKDEEGFFRRLSAVLPG